MAALKEVTLEYLRISENRDEVIDVLKDEKFLIVDTENLCLTDFAKLNFLVENFSKISIEDLEAIEKKIKK